ncbi:MAG: type II toxin-antitoxin system VapC family toxin [Bacteroidota bacterium]
MIVADTNLIAYLFFETPYSEEATAVHQKDAEWAAPVLWRSEFVNVVSLYLRKNIIAYKDSLDALEFAQATLRGKEFSVSMYSVLQFVNLSKCNAFDCEFVALAHELDVPLVTYDEKILREFSNIAISASDFLKSQPR